MVALLDKSEVKVTKVHPLGIINVSTNFYDKFWPRETFTCWGLARESQRQTSGNTESDY